ncbi:SpoIIE family protein phosphatase [Streptomyces pilosus]|uniref:SpoIIE family protein phosphatase n=1 Tax=Streptomyces pilosus TaxID=28893 RepID=UPI003642F53C
MMLERRVTHPCGQCGQCGQWSETSHQVEQTLIERFATSRYVTAILADLDMETGRLTWINRGHHLPILIRDNRWTSELACPPAGPMGADLDLPFQVLPSYATVNAVPD